MPLKLAERETKKILGVAAGKGGVGKSTVAINLALALKEKGLKVGLIDADLTGPSLRKMLPEEKLPTRDSDGLLPATSRGIKTLSMAHFKKEGDASPLRAPMMNQILQQFVNETVWGELDYLLIDFPPGTGDIPISLSQMIRIDGIVLVTTPQEVACIDVKKAGGFFKSLKTPVLGLVENMSYYLHPASQEKIFLFGSGGTKLSLDLEVPLLAQIPLDPELSRFQDLGFSIFDSESELLNTSKNVFRTLALSIQESLKKKDEGLYILNISSEGPFSFVIEWSDGKKLRFQLADLQNHCPCAACKDKTSRIEKAEARGLTNVGRYALKIDFLVGCTQGIYSFELLRQLGETC